jgi:pilus assembly protein CpaC
VTPTVIDRDLIRMRIVPEFSEANQSLAVGGIPGLNSRRVQTTVELREGQTIAIAGLISHQTNVEVTRIPFLGELPVIGPKLFNAKRASQDESELLVLVTPELVRPMDPDEVPPVPGYEVTHPNQWELCNAAMTEGAPDTSYYQVPPLGSDSNYGINVPFRLFNPVPAAPQYAPVPNNTFGSLPREGQPPTRTLAAARAHTGAAARTAAERPAHHVLAATGLFGSKRDPAREVSSPPAGTAKLNRIRNSKLS